MTDRIDAIARLRPIERQRLERFAAAFDRLDASRYATLTESTTSAEVEAVQARAVELLGVGGRQQAVRGVVAEFVDAATQAYSRRVALPDTFLLFQSLPDRTEDRVHFLASVERAVVALVLWDELEDDDRVVLAGPWLAIIEASIVE